MEKEYNNSSKFSLWDVLFQYRFIIIGLLLAGAVVFKLSGSSVNCWNQVIWGKSLLLDSHTLLGKARNIRSDEYAVNLPLLISQELTKFPYFSDIVGGTKTDMFMVYGQPVWDIAVLFRPFHWGYLLLGLERGLAFFWFGRLLVTFIVAFEFGRLITRDNRALSLALAFMIAGSSVLQWWFAVNSIAELLIYGMGAVLLINLYMTRESLKIRIFTAIVFSICVGGYAVSLYPAWQIPFAYIFAPIGIYYLVTNLKARKWFISDTIIIVVMFLFIAIMLGRIVIKSWDTIQAVLNSAYPGDRFEQGGGFAFAFFRYILGLFTPFYEINSYGTNLCEEAKVFDLFPLCWIIPLWLIFKEKKRDKLLIIMLITSAFLALWLVFKFPVWYAKITLLSKVPPNRLYQAVGFLNLFILFRSISIVDKKFNLAFSVIVSLVFSVLCVITVHLQMPAYLNTNRTICGLIVLFLSMLFAMQSFNKNVENFACICLVIGLINIFGVNPIEQGLDTLYEDGVLGEIRYIDDEDSGIWVVEGMDFPTNNYTIMAGVRTLNSTSTYPNIEKWSKVDKEHKYEDCYNRYAHILIDLQKEGKTEFELIQTDIFKIKLNVNDLEKYDVKYIFTRNDLSEFNNDKVSFENIRDNDNLKIYKVNYNK